MTNMSLRMERLRNGWSQQQLADFALVSLSTVARAERGMPIRVDCIQRLSECLSKSPEQLELVKIRIVESRDSQDASSQQENIELEPEDEIEMNRREATKTIGKILGTTLLGATQPLEQLSTLLKPIHVDAHTLEHFGTLTEICWKLGNGHELETAGAILETYLPKVVRLAQQPSPYQKVAAGIASQGHLLSASLAGHRDDLNARQSHSEKAFQYGHVAEDHNLQVAALKQLAVTYDYKQRPGKALEVYQSAIPYLDSISPLVRAGICIRMSDALAQCSQEQEALRFLSIARESFPDAPEDDPGYLYADSGLYSLLLWEGLIHLDLDMPKEAEKAFARVDGLSPKIEVPERVRIEFLTYQAATYIALRELDQSCIYIEASAKSAIALGSERRYSEAFDTYQQMRQVWMYEPRIKALTDLFVR